jgi:hypothetical protein
MSFDDEFGGFLDRETVLGGGVPAKRANTLLFLIESRTAHLVVRSRQAMELFLTQARASPRREIPVYLHHKLRFSGGACAAPRERRPPLGRGPTRAGPSPAAR